MGLTKRATDSDEAALIERCRKHDVQAFGRLVDAYHSRVHGFVRRMVLNDEEAWDLSQEVFIRAYQNFGRFDGRSSVKTWLFRIAYNLCIDYFRRTDRRPTEVSLPLSSENEETFDVPDDRWEPEEFLMNAELVEVVEKAIETMSEKLRCVLLLHDREDASYEEIAQTLDLPMGTVKSRLFLARAHLQEALRPYLQEESVL